MLETYRQSYHNLCSDKQRHGHLADCVDAGVSLQSRCAALADDDDECSLDAALSTMGLYRRRMRRGGAGGSLYRAVASHLGLDAARYAPALRRASDAWRAGRGDASPLEALAAVLGTSFAVLCGGERGVLAVRHVTPPEGAAVGDGGGGVVLCRLPGGRYDAVVREATPATPATAATAATTATAATLVASPPVVRPAGAEPTHTCGSYLTVNLGGDWSSVSTSPSTTPMMSPSPSLSPSAQLNGDAATRNYISGTRQRAPSTEHRRRGDRQARRASQPASVRVNTQHVTRSPGQHVRRLSVDSVTSLLTSSPDRASRPRRRLSLVIPIRHSCSSSGFASPSSGGGASPPAPHVHHVHVTKVEPRPADWDATSRASVRARSQRPLAEREDTRRRRNARLSQQDGSKQVYKTTETSVREIRRSSSVDSNSARWTDGSPIKLRGTSIGNLVKSFGENTLFEKGELESLLRNVWAD